MVRDSIDTSEVPRDSSTEASKQGIDDERNLKNQNPPSEADITMEKVGLSFSESSYQKR